MTLYDSTFKWNVSGFPLKKSGILIFMIFVSVILVSHLKSFLGYYSAVWNSSFIFRVGFDCHFILMVNLILDDNYPLKYLLASHFCPNTIIKVYFILLKYFFFFFARISESFFSSSCLSNLPLDFASLNFCSYLTQNSRWGVTSDLYDNITVFLPPLEIILHHISISWVFFLTSESCKYLTAMQWLNNASWSFSFCRFQIMAYDLVAEFLNYSPSLWSHTLHYHISECLKSARFRNFSQKGSIQHSKSNQCTLIFSGTSENDSSLLSSLKFIHSIRTLPSESFIFYYILHI